MGARGEVGEFERRVVGRFVVEVGIRWEGRWWRVGVVDDVRGRRRGEFIQSVQLALQCSRAEEGGQHTFERETVEGVATVEANREEEGRVAVRATEDN